MTEYGLSLTAWEDLPTDADAIVAAVSHAAFRERPIAELLALLKPGGAFIDIKSAYDREAILASGARLWRL
jgi:UDP-N-acetyl-D-galactosamine dehydrogenase